MGVWHLKSRRKSTGGLIRKHRKNKKIQMGSLPTKTTIANHKLRKKNVRGGNKKTIIISANKINVLDKNSKKFIQTEIQSVIKNPANHNFVRRGIITKGALIKTTVGSVKVTSRPGQNQILNGVLVQ